MNTKQLLILSMTFLGLVGGFVSLALAGVDTDSYGAFIVGAIVPTIAASYGAKRAGEASDYAKQAEKNTNGNLTRLFDILDSKGMIKDASTNAPEQSGPLE